jgi:integrase
MGDSAGVALSQPSAVEDKPFGNGPLPNGMNALRLPPAPNAAGPSTPENGLGEAQQKLRRMVLHSVSSPHTRRNYAKGLDDLFALSAGRPLDRALFMEYRASMEALAPSTVNVRLSAVRKLVAEARGNGLISADEAASLLRIPNIRQQGTRLGNWLTREQAKQLLTVPCRSTLKGTRDYAILALLLGCALRREELATLDIETIQLREGRWVLADLVGKGGRIRTVAVPVWVKQGINAWMTAAGIEDGRLVRSISKGGKVGKSLGAWSVWSVVEQSAKEIGIDRFGAHDLRQTCAKLCRKNGGKLEQIKFLLGHSSIETTERYLGSEQEIAIAVNDSLGL